VAASSASNAWAVGNTSNGGQSHTLALHWNGRRWARVSTPSPANPAASDGLTSVAVTSTSNAWAVEGVNGLLHWNGRSWTAVQTPEVPGATFSLSAVAARSAGSAWAVGTLSNGAPPTQPFAIHCC